jgi:hypothetical protein
VSDTAVRPSASLTELFAKAHNIALRNLVWRLDAIQLV